MLVTQVYLVFKLIYVYGICPFKLNKSKKTFSCSWYYTFYSSFIFIITLFISIFVYLKEIFNNGLSHEFKNMISSVGTVANCSIVTFYFCHMFDLIIQRFNHVNFLDTVLRIDDKIAEYSVKKIKILSKYAWPHAFIPLFIIISNIPVLVYQAYQFSINSIIWSLVVAFQITTAFQISMYIRNYATILISNFDRVKLMLNNLIGENVNEHRNSILLCFELFEELERLKTSFSTTFGVQILIINVNDLVISTITLYSIMYWLYVSKFNWFYLWLFATMCLPNIIKCVLFTSSLDKLGVQVIS